MKCGKLKAEPAVDDKMYAAAPMDLYFEFSISYSGSRRRMVTTVALHAGHESV
jgi:hypothetical protein